MAGPSTQSMSDLSIVPSDMTQFLKDYPDQKRNLQKLIESKNQEIRESSSSSSSSTSSSSSSSGQSQTPPFDNDATQAQALESAIAEKLAECRAAANRLKNAMQELCLAELDKKRKESELHALGGVLDYEVDHLQTSLADHTKYRYITHISVKHRHIETNAASPFHQTKSSPFPTSKPRLVHPPPADKKIPRPLDAPDCHSTTTATKPPSLSTPPTHPTCFPQTPWRAPHAAWRTRLRDREIPS
ncbi:hypothetical protein HG530_014543 [Fusarium avenaceum]|nr:hypothetical protein HG530_014543 [Fusarium avenaceum]